MRKKFASLIWLLMVTMPAIPSELSAQQPGVVAYGPAAAVQPTAPFWASPQGFGLRPVHDVYLTALGYFVPSSMPYDPAAAGVVEYLYSIDADGALQVAARSTDPHPVAGPIGDASGVLGEFVYATLTNPVLLQAGQLYVTTHFGPMQVDIVDPGVVLSSDFVIDGGYIVTPNGDGAPGVQRIDAPIQTGVGFLYMTVAPEPTSLSLLLTGSGLIAAIFIGRTRRSRTQGSL
jgi:hypothetical protein